MKLLRPSRYMAFAAGALIAIAPFSAQLAQAQPARQLYPMLTGLELTQPQQAQLQVMANQTRSQIEQILRPEQRTALQTALSQGQPLPQAISSMNLTNEQTAQLRQVLQAARQQAASILTPEQKQQLRQNLRAKGFTRVGNR